MFLQFTRRVGRRGPVGLFVNEFPMAPGLVSYSMRATASYLYEGLVVTTLSETGADNGRASARCLRVGV